MAEERADRRGLILILSSPSGAGKTTLTRMLLQKKELDLTLSISLTTRKRRSSEADGIHYHFIDQAEFAAPARRRRIAGARRGARQFLRHAARTGRGDSGEGRDVLFDVDYQGARQVREKMPRDIVTIFILPPSMRELRARLERRAEDSQDVILKRLDNARHEIGRWAEYDYVLVNDDIQQTFDDLLAIVRAERLRRPRVAASVENFVARLLKEQA